MKSRMRLCLVVLLSMIPCLWGSNTYAATGWTMPTGGAIASTPLMLKGSVPPNVLFALSVEYPTAITAAYPDASSYSSSTTYLGYFDNAKCYLYDTTNGWFYPTGVATSHACTNSWSGNFLNWATMTGLDEFRFAMTGGNRYQDTASSTVLQRTYMSNQGSAGSNFADKTFTGAGATPYPSTAALTLKNWNQGVNMLVTSTTLSSTVSCSGPQLSGSSFNCATLTLNDTFSSTATCSTWSGAGTNASPYKCSTFGLFSNGETVTSITGTTSTHVTTSASADTVTCSSPSYTTSFSCTLSLTGGETGTCTTWSGTGATSGTAKTCTAFGGFSGGKVINSSAPGTVSSTAYAYNGATFTCTYSGGTFSCGTLPNGDSVTCSTKTGNGGTSPYHCTAFTGSGGESITVTSYSSSTGSSPNKYYKNYTVNYSGTLYYVQTYSVNASTDYYYASSYNVNYAYPTTYAVRVKVCDSSVGLEGNCTQYGSNYKPEGVIQANGQNMRFGVFSYFNSNIVDNAVMRSKAKYTAPLKYSSSGAVTNSNAEWSGTDGTFTANPDPAVASASYPSVVTNSGVINYINKFGSSSLNYKTLDDVGKLYYEALKYLRGLQPTSQFYSSATAATADGFPVITSWDDPFKDDAAQTTPYSCRKNYIITMGDTHTWCDKQLPGGTFTTTGSTNCNSPNSLNASGDMGSLGGDAGVNVTTWTNALGVLDGRGSSLATSMTGAGGGSYYMSGLAYWANNQDIRSDIPGAQNVKTFVIDVEEKSSGQVDCGYNSQYWEAAKFGGADGFDGTTGQPTGWSTTLTLPAGACGTRAPSWYSATASSSGAWPKNLLRGNDPAGMISAVNQALSTIAAQNGQIAALAQSSGSLVGGGAYLYRASFSTNGWKGDLNAWAIDASGTVASSATWSAADNLPATGSRIIYTYNDGLKADGTSETSTNARKGVVFDSSQLTTNFSTRQQSFLNMGPTGTVDSQGAARVAYLRGVVANESPNGLGWRARTSLLGDIVDSNPTYVGVPDVAYLPGTGYSQFVQNVKNRTPVVYVGGNDGMLHGFDASPVGTSGHTPGKELMAFVPGSVYFDLNQLMWPNYSHHYYVDGSPTVGNACFGSCTGVSSWKTMLVGGLRSGGKGVYALDVTDPSNFTTANASSIVLWEFSNMDDQDLGFTYSKPIIRKMNNGKWAVIFGNGLNSTSSNGSTGDQTSSTGRAYLYVLFVDGPGAGNGWGTPCSVLSGGTTCNSPYYYYKLELKSPGEPSTPSLPLSPPNGVTTVAAVDTDGNGTADILYAGDLQGDVWKIDVSNSNPQNWKSAFGTAASPTPLFRATDGVSTPGYQPITSGFQVSRNPYGGYLVLFGTGSYIYSSDAISPYQQESFYGIWDQNSSSQSVPISRSLLQKQGQIAVQTSGSYNYAIQSNCTPNYSGSLTTTGDGIEYDCPSSLAVTNPPTQMGWVFDLPGTGERVIMDHPLLDSGILEFTTMAPSSSDPCTGGTTGWIYDLDYLTGGRASYSVYTTTVGGTIPVMLSYATSSGGTVSIAPSGRQLPGGASDVPASFKMTPTSVPNPSDTTSTMTLGQAFIPGWGVPALMRSKLCSPKVAVANGQTDSTIGQQACGSKGRVSWRQIMQ